MMPLKNESLIVILSFLLAGCPWGDYVPQAQLSTVSRTDDAVCFSFPNAGDYRPAYLSVRERAASPGSGFNKKLPPLKVTANHLCIPDSYYHFPDNGDFYADVTLESPGREKEQRILIAVFRLVDGQPQMLEPEPGEF